MPTGYTANIPKGQSFEDFVMGCARAFGSCITLVDTPDAEIPERFEPNRYRTMAFVRAIETLRALEAMSPEEWEQAFTEEVSKARERNAATRREAEEVKKAYEAMYSRVLEWRPPTGEHVKLWSFMLEQITKSIDLECGSVFQDQVPQSVDTYRAERLTAAKKDLEWKEKKLAEEIDRAESRTAWVRALRASLEEGEKSR